MTDQSNIFSDAEAISCYSRAEAIADGVLIDVTEAAQEAGFKVPVAITHAVWVDCVEWAMDAGKAAEQDESGRLWDVLWMGYHACMNPGEGQRRDFQLYRVRQDACENGPSLVTLSIHIGPGDNAEPVITIMLPDED